MEQLTRGSWKTTTTGMVGFLVLVGDQAQAMLDGSAATVPDWPTVVAGFVVLLMGYLARDNNRTSEAVGAK